MTTASARELRQRLNRARARQREVVSGRAADESGVRPLQRPNDIQPVPASTRPAVAPVSIAPVMPAAPSGQGTALGKTMLLLVGVALGATITAVMSGSVSFVSSRPASQAASALPHSAIAEPAQIPTLRIASVPEGAEIVLRGAVVANTPARVPQPTYEALYLLRRGGYHPALVRVLPHSGDIVVTLRSLDEELPPPSPPRSEARAKKSTPAKARGEDVGRQSTAERSDGSPVGRSAR